MPGAKKPELKELEKDHFCACHLTEAEKVMKKAEIDGKPVKKAQRAVIGDEICLDVKDVRKYFPIYKGNDAQTYRRCKRPLRISVSKLEKERH